jgi:DNA-binding MarR family transcriptional regulator
VRDRSSDVKAPGDWPENVVFDTWLAARATAGILDDALAPAGLDADEFAIYSVLSAAGSMTPSELARWMAAPPTTVSSYVKRFETRGHVARARNPDDGRSYLLSLTQEGREVHSHASELFVPILNGVVAHLGRHRDSASRELRRLRGVLDELRSAE